MSLSRAAELCRKLKPVLGRKIDLLWAVHQSDSTAAGKAEIEQTLELLAAKHLGDNFEPDRSPFPPPSESFATKGTLALGEVTYGGRAMYPFRLQPDRLKEHLLIAGRSGSGKTNLTFVLLDEIMRQDIKVLALDWKRGYRDLLQHRTDLRVYTIGRDVAPFKFNPFIPPAGCEPDVWIKLIVDVIASAYFGGEGVISLFVKGLDHLYREAGIFDGTCHSWPTVSDLLAWLQTTKLTGRAAMWKASAERILLAMTYGSFAKALQTQDNTHVRDLLAHHVVMEMDGLSSNSDRRMFSEALMLYLYRYLMARGPSAKLTNVVVLEEAHNLLLAREDVVHESVLENSIRMIRQYGLGYVFVDQSASMLSKVAFANSYATIALSQKLATDVRAIASAMNLTDTQKEALRTLPIGSAVVRLADEHPEPFLVRVPRSPVVEGAIDDAQVRQAMYARGGGDLVDSGTSDTSGGSGGSGGSRVSGDIPPTHGGSDEVTAIPAADKYRHAKDNPPVGEDATAGSTNSHVHLDHPDHPPLQNQNANIQMSRDVIRYLDHIVQQPLATTVQRYEQLHLSRRRGNAIRNQLIKSGLVDSVPLPTRSGQVVLQELTDAGRAWCQRVDIDPGPASRESLEHRFWIQKAKAHYEREGYDVMLEYAVDGNGLIDLVATKNEARLHVEIETGRSDIANNLIKAQHVEFDRTIMIATSPTAVTRCQRAVSRVDQRGPPIELLTWLDVS